MPVPTINMNVSRTTVWNVHDSGYMYVNEEGDYYCRIFMDELDAEDLFFPVMLGPRDPNLILPEDWEF